MNTGWMKARQTRFTAYATLYIAIIIGVLGLVNWLGQRHNKSVDTTANKRYSLSDQTEKVVKGLDRDVKITYWNKTEEFRGAKDLLDRYDNMSAKLSVDYIDPDKKPQLAKAANIRQYGTIAVQAGPRQQEAKSLTEEEVTGALIRALKGGERTVCSVAGSGEHSFEETGRSGYSNLKESLERNNYKTRTVSLLEKAEVPKDCTVLLIAGPKFDYTDAAVKAIKTYVESGGHALFFLAPPLKSGQQEVGENTALVGLLASWGVIANKDLAIDTSGVGQFFGFSEAVPLVTSYESHAIVREMKEIATAFPLARSLDTKNGDKTTVEKLFSTGPNSFSSNITGTSGATLAVKPDKKGPLALGAAGTYNTGQTTGQGRFVVVGSADWTSNGILRFNGNRDLALNMFNWLSSDEDLISIRPKEPEDRRLQITGKQMNVVFYTSLVLLPLAVIFAGVGVWWRRR